MKDQFTEPEPFEEQSIAGPPSFRLQRLIPVLRKKWWILILTTALAVGAAVTYLSQQETVYVSRARMWVPGKIRVNEVAQYIEDLQNFSGTQIELIRSEKMRERTFENLRRQDTNFALPTDAEGQPLALQLRVTQVPKTAMFLLECSSPRTNHLQAYLNAVMDEFLLYKSEVHAGTSKDVVDSVSKQVVAQQRALKAEQENLSLFQSSNNIALLEEEVRGGGAQLARLNDQLAMLKLDMKLLDAAALERSVGAETRTNLLSTVADPARALGLSSAAQTPATDFLASQQQVEAIKSQRDQFGRYLRPKHPKMVKLNEEIERGEKVIQFYRRQGEAQLATSKEAMKIRIDSLETSVKELQARVGEANRKYVEYDRIRAAIQRQQAVYDRLLSLLQGLDISSNIDQGGLTILERASPPKPTRSLTIELILGGLVGGIMAGLGILFLIARFDDRCESLDDVRAEFAELVLSQLPELKKPKSNGKLLVLGQTANGIFAESCRHLRSSLLYGQPTGVRPRTFLVTSAAPNEGKSTVAANLAHALALGGTRVLLIDGDLRCGRLHEMFNVTPEPGLTELVMQSGDLVSATLPTPLPKLSFLPRGKSSENSGEVFLTAVFDRLLEQARQQFDYIVIDSVPVFAADDATTLAPKMDGVLFVVRRAHTSARLAREALDLLYQRQVKVLGLVFNRANSSARSYRYYKYADYYLKNGGKKKS